MFEEYAKISLWENQDRYVSEGYPRYTFKWEGDVTLPVLILHKYRNDPEVWDALPWELVKVGSYSKDVDIYQRKGISLSDQLNSD